MSFCRYVYKNAQLGGIPCNVEYCVYKRVGSRPNGARREEQGTRCEAKSIDAKDRRQMADDRGQISAGNWQRAACSQCVGGWRQNPDDRGRRTDYNFEFRIANFEFGKA